METFSLRQYSRILIITNNALKPHFEVLAKYKTQKGIPTVLVTVEQIYQNFSGVDNAEKVRNYLKSAHQFWGSGLSVLLGGDTAVVPRRIGVKNPFYSNVYDYTDMYYCDVFKDGDPNYNWDSNNDGNFGYDNDPVELGADNFIGRAPVDTVLETTNFVNKIISYENLTDVSQTNYVNNMLFLGAYPNYNYLINYYNSTGQKWHRELADRPLLNSSNLKNICFLMIIWVQLIIYILVMKN